MTWARSQPNSWMMGSRNTPNVSLTPRPSIESTKHSARTNSAMRRDFALSIAFVSPRQAASARGSTSSPLVARLHARSAHSGRNSTMAKAYWVATYRSISDADALAAYAKLAGPAIAAAGGRFLVRGTAAKAYEAGVLQRVVIVEFDSVDKAVAAHDS